MKIVTVYWVALLASVSSLFYASWTGARPMVIFACGMIPLVFYHFRLWVESRKKSSAGVHVPLTTTTIDSIYYFGFIITIATLASAVLQVSLRGVNQNYMDVVSQFGLGLVATGYAVFARMQLLSANEALGFIPEKELVDEYFHSVKSLAESIKLSADEFASYTRLLAEQQTQLLAEFRTQTHQSMIASTNAFSEKLNAVFKQSYQELSILNTSVTSIDFGSDVAELKEQTKAVGQALNYASGRIGAFSKALDGAQISISQASENTQKLATAAGNVATQAEGIGVVAIQMRSLEESFKAIVADGVTVHETFGQVQAQVEKVVLAVSDSLNALTESLRVNVIAAGEHISSMTGNFNTFSELLLQAQTAFKSASNNLQSLSSSSELAAGKLAGIGEAGPQLLQMRDAVQAIDTHLKQLAQTVGTVDTKFIDAMEKLEGSVSKLVSQIETGTNTSSDAVTRLTTSLASIADYIIKETSQAQSRKVA